MEHQIREQQIKLKIIIDRPKENNSPFLIQNINSIFVNNVSVFTPSSGFRSTEMKTLLQRAKVLDLKPKLEGGGIRKTKKNNIDFF